MATYPNNPNAVCAFKVIIGTPDGPVEVDLNDLDDIATGPDEIWQEVVPLRETEELAIAPGVTATRITSFSMQRPNGKVIKFSFGPI